MDIEASACTSRAVDEQPSFQIKEGSSKFTMAHSPKVVNDSFSKRYLGPLHESIATTSVSADGSLPNSDSDSSPTVLYNRSGSRWISESFLLLRTSMKGLKNYNFFRVRVRFPTRELFGIISPPYGRAMFFFDRQKRASYVPQYY